LPPVVMMSSYWGGCGW